MNKKESEIREHYKNAIVLLVETCNDMEYLIAVYTFASTYPRKNEVQKE